MNKLTTELTAQGYDEINHPDWVYVGGSRSNPTLDNWEGGFKYYYWHIAKLTYETPCGIHCRYESIMTGTAYMGIEWSYENDCPLVHCPYYNTECDKRHKYLAEIRGMGKDWCNVHKVNKPYTYEESLEQLHKLHEDDIRNRQISFIMQRNNRVCKNHMSYNRDAGEWEYHFDPMTCGRLGCSAIANGTCPIVQKTDKQKGNVYYDRKIRYRRRDLDGTLFDGQIDTVIEKDNQVFTSPINFAVCQMVANMCKDQITANERLRHHDKIFFAQYYGDSHFYELEIINVRAEKKLARDLEQDLRDIADGIAVIHVRDSIKEKKELKHRKRVEADEKRREKLRKKLVQVGLENLDEYSLDAWHAKKWFDSVDMRAIERERQEMLTENQNAPTQMTIFDLM